VEADDGNGGWVFDGTGFLMFSDENTPHLLVTNRHIFRHEVELEFLSRGRRFKLRQICCLKSARN